MSVQTDAATKPSLDAITTKAALLWEQGPGAQFSVEEVLLDPPKGPEVRVRVKAAGLCHSDEHLRVGDYALDWGPCLGGHEGAGIIEEVGSDVIDLEVGDHVVFSFVPACGRCRLCVTGHSNLCVFGASALSGKSIYDGTQRVHTMDGRGVGQFVQVGSFAQQTVVHQQSVVKVDKSYPLEKAALVGCGVTTGWGSAVNTAKAKAGDVAVVIGVGGVGMNAIQGFRAAGASIIVAVDPVEWKGLKAVESFGATHSVTSLEAAQDLVRELTWGQMADGVVLTVGVAEGWMLEPAMALLGHKGVLVFTAVAHVNARDAKIDMFSLTHYEKELKGSLYGSANPRADIPAMLKNFERGLVNLDDLITNTYQLDDINQGYADMLEGKNIRGVVLFD